MPVVDEQGEDLDQDLTQRDEDDRDAGVTELLTALVGTRVFDQTGGTELHRYADAIGGVAVNPVRHR